MTVSYYLKGFLSCLDMLEMNGHKKCHKRVILLQTLSEMLGLF